MNHSFSWLQFPAGFTSVAAESPSADGGFQRSLRFLPVCVASAEKERMLNCRMLNSLCVLFIVQLQNKTQLGEETPLTPLYLNRLSKRPACEPSSLKQMFFIFLLFKAGVTKQTVTCSANPDRRSEMEAIILTGK